MILMWWATFRSPTNHVSAKCDHELRKKDALCPESTTGRQITLQLFLNLNNWSKTQCLACWSWTKLNFQCKLSTSRSACHCRSHSSCLHPACIQHFRSYHVSMKTCPLEDLNVSLKLLFILKWDSLSSQRPSTTGADFQIKSVTRMLRLNSRPSVNTK